MNDLTLDLDSMSESKIRKKAELIKLMFPASNVKYRVSSGGNGGHVLANNIGNIPFEEIVGCRILLGDDHRRIAKDVNRRNHGLITQVLFDRKIKDGVVHNSSKWTEVV